MPKSGVAVPVPAAVAHLGALPAPSLATDRAGPKAPPAGRPRASCKQPSRGSASMKKLPKLQRSGHEVAVTA
jgi:hypothetical protein